MAEKSYRDGSTRRRSFRRTLADAELTDEDLEKLEAKRKQLDESIHKFIAAKERDYKSFEREFIQRHRLGQDKEGPKVRRTSSETTQDAAVDLPRLRAQHKNAVAALLSAGLRRDQIQLGQPVPIAVVDDDGPGTVFEAKASAAGLVDRRASIERDKEFVGVFTPVYLPALEHRGLSLSSGAGSAPPVGEPSGHDGTAQVDGVQRANLDPVVQARPRRPVELQFSNRTSSSGSSADGKLPSALKSPTHTPKPRKKRVSLAVGNSIVAPSDNVPVSTSNNSTPSHSRTRTPSSERDRPRSAPHNWNERVAGSAASSVSPTAQAAVVNGPKKAQPHEDTGKSPDAEGTSPPAAVPIIPGPSRSPPIADVDGDLDFNLDHDDEGLGSDQPVEDSPMDSEDDIAGRVARAPNDEDEIYESSEGLMPEAEESDDHAQHIEFRPSSIQQPTSPGFRRPSVSMDPVYTGSNYSRAESSAVANEIYGSSFNRPSSKGSFTAGSLGESFMAQNAERMMRDRAASEQTQVRS